MFSLRDKRGLIRGYSIKTFHLKGSKSIDFKFQNSPVLESERRYVSLRLIEDFSLVFYSSLITIVSFPIKGPICAGRRSAYRPLVLLHTGVRVRLKPLFFVTGLDTQVFSTK